MSGRRQSTSVDELNGFVFVRKEPHFSSEIENSRQKQREDYLLPLVITSRLAIFVCELLI